ncbi:alpha-1,2-mannosidase, putative [Bryocella elongata]|uniref:Alpha-1,2-mannosidase, putative n=1 Tax=Bryocella elongata TaxID=863522 RepID=A0A1H5TCY7_9BACT|nr:GH92 family glycosyl hydrolase [Bryocella elongata]SEF60659.1 alpha-1,2-mannosidase, putative [Bryocella elongata]
MMSRRNFLQSAAVCATATLPRSLWSAPVGPDANDPLRWVDVRIGTGGHGHCFPGSSVPFAAVQLSPDTGDDGWDWCGGYYVEDTSIMGFSHTHLSGTGCGDLLDFLVMAGTGPVKLTAGPKSNPEAGYRSRFSHEKEVAEPGYYSVFLEDPKVKVELTSTERTGIHRYTFPASEDAWLIVDLHHSYLTNGGSSVYNAHLSQTAPDTLAGGHVTRAWGHDRECFFTMKFSRKPDTVTFYSDDTPVTNPETLRGNNLKAVLHYRTHAGEQILVRTGISGVSTTGAAGNLAAEQPDWNFDHTRETARRKWSEQIGRIKADIHDPEQKKIFYTALYHMSLGPQLFDDADGQYRGMDRTTHHLPAGHHNYTTFSLWDTFRAAHPTYTLIQRDRLPDFINTLTRMAQQSEAGMAVWPLQGTETGTMTGYHSASVMAEAIVKGTTGIDNQAAYECMLERANQENYRGLGYYRQMGYIPADREPESVSKTFEYCYNDYAVACTAAKLGQHDMAQKLLERSRNYKHFFNPANTFMQAKMADGSFAVPFDPIEMGHSKEWRDYTESNAWQTTFGVMHDPAGLIALFGGMEPFLTKLDLLFTVPSTLPPDAPPDIAGMIGQYAHGNEPSHHIAYLYVYAGQPWKTQQRIRNIMDTLYHAAPDGMAGNEDVGQMSAWFLLSALGFYPVAPVSQIYIIGSPLVDHATVDLGSGKQLIIDAKRSSPTHQYVQSWTLNGVEQKRAWFRHSDITNGGHIVFQIGAEPNRTLGSDVASLPPSMELPHA